MLLLYVQRPGVRPGPLRGVGGDSRWRCGEGPGADRRTPCAAFVAPAGGVGREASVGRWRGVLGPGERGGAYDRIRRARGAHADQAGHQIGEPALGRAGKQAQGQCRGHRRQAEHVHHDDPGRRLPAGVQAVHQGGAPGRVGERVQRAPAAGDPARCGEGAAQGPGRRSDDHQQPGERTEADETGRAAQARAERYEGAEQSDVAEGDLHRAVQQEEAE